MINKFGLPKIFITDNGTQFDNRKFRDFCSSLQIDHNISSVSYPQTNGQAKMTNKEILKEIKKKVEKPNGVWIDELNYILWELKITEKFTTC